MASRLRAPLLLITLLALAGSARAEGLDEKGHALAKEATRLYKQGSYEDAAKLFAQLSVDYPDMTVFERNAGACFYYLHRPEPALSNLRNYLNHTPNVEPDDKAVVDRWIAEMEKLRVQNAAASAPSPAPPPAPVPVTAPMPAPVIAAPADPGRGLYAAPGASAAGAIGVGAETQYGHGPSAANSMNPPANRGWIPNQQQPAAGGPQVRYPAKVTEAPGGPLGESSPVPSFRRGLLFMPYLGEQVPIKAKGFKSALRYGLLVGGHLSENISLSGDFAYAAWDYSNYEYDYSDHLKKIDIGATLLRHVGSSWGEFIVGPQLGLSVFTGGGQTTKSFECGLKMGLLVAIGKSMALGLVADLLVNKWSANTTTLGVFSIAVLF